MEHKIHAYENFNIDENNKLGTLYYDNIRGKEIYSFEYDEEWLKTRNLGIVLDPELPFVKGRIYPSKEIFGIFEDISPDRWGKTLMNRRERIEASKEERQARKLNSRDYLIGVCDKTRMGAIRLKKEENGEFLSNNEEQPTPPWENLRTLENASREFEKDNNILNERWLKELLEPGSSLGGARPKAIIKDTENNLWIAKFPSKDDEYDIGKWEKITSDLAKLCNLNVPESKLEKFSNLGSTFLVKRFDRDNNRRIHYASAMTLLNKKDGETDISYLDIASFIKSNSISPKVDLIELWKRIVFNMAVRNTDDHLRNHGFLLNKNGWRLSPLFDVNPTPLKNMLSLNVNETDNRISKELLLEIAPIFMIDEKDANIYIENITTIIKDNWIVLAKKYNASKKELEEMKDAFAFCYNFN